MPPYKAPTTGSEVPSFGSDPTTTATGDTTTAGSPSSTAWKNPSGGVTGPKTSLWGKDYASRAQLATTLYNDSTQGYIPLQQRVLLFRQQVNGGTTTPSLDSVLDYYVDYRGRLPYGTPTDFGNQHGVTIAQYLDEVRGYDHTKMQDLQKQLAAAGFYTADIYGGKKKVQAGVYDNATRQALNSAITEMIVTGTKHSHGINDFLKERAADVAANGGPQATTGAASVIHLTNPLDIQSTYRSVSQKLTGQEHADQAAGAVGDYQAQELSSGKAQIAAAGVDGAPGPGGGITDPASADAYAEAQLRQNSGPEVAAHTALGIYNTLLQRVGLAG